MPIEFRCHHCNTLLRVGDEAAGLQAKCPKCGTVSAVPARSEPPAVTAPASPPLVPPSGAAPNPFASPLASVPPPGATGPFQSQPIVHTPLDVGDVLQRAWRVYFDNLGLCLLFTLCLIGAMAACYLAIGGPGLLIGVVLAQTLGHQAAPWIVCEALFLFGCLVLLVMWLSAGETIFILKLARGQEAKIGDLFSGGPYLWSFTGVGLAFGLMVGLGTMLCFVPGVILALVYFPATLLVIDRNVGFAEAFSGAAEITRGNRLSLLLLFLVSFGISMIAGFIPCGGLLVLPLTQLLAVIGYLRMTGQPTAGAEPR